jgi:hypothetical protein
VIHNDGVLDLLTLLMNYIYEIARLNGYAREPIEKLAIKHSNRHSIRPITTLTPLQKEAQNADDLQLCHTADVENIQRCYEEVNAALHTPDC